MRLVNCQRDFTLERDGFVVLQGLMGGELLDELREKVTAVYALEGEAAGMEFKQEPGCRRLANLVDKGEVFRRIIAHSETLPCVERVLGPEFKLSSCNARKALPNNGVHQPLHADMSAVPDERGAWVCNLIWLLDDFTEDNGSLRAVPGSHRFGKLPKGTMEDPYAPHPDEVRLTGRAGDVIVINAHCWHGGLANRTGEARIAVHTFYCRRDKPQQQYQKAMLSPETQAGLSPQLRRLLALDDPLNDTLSAEAKVRSGFMK